MNSPSVKGGEIKEGDFRMKILVHKVMFKSFIGLFVVLFAAQISFAEDAQKEGSPIKNLYGKLQEHGFTGFLRGDYFSSDKARNDKTDFAGITAQLKLLPRFSDKVEGRFEVRAYNFDLLNRNNPPSPPFDKGGNGGVSEILEGLFIFRFDNSDLSAGKQIITWGRADGVNPTDNLSPKDYTLLLPEDSDRKTGVSSLKYDYYLSPDMTATFFYTPFFEPNKIPLALPDFIKSKESKPSHNLENSEFAFKLNKIGSDLDWSVSYFNGFDLTPQVKYLSSQNGNIFIELSNPRIQVLGADFAKNYGRYGFRGEAAYMLTDDMDGIYPYLKNPNMYYIIGGDRTFIETLNINLQFIGRYIFKYSDVEKIQNQAERSIYIKNATFNSELDEVQYSMSGRVDYKLFNETLDMEMFVVYNFNRNDYFVRPIVRYAFTDSWKGTIGGEFYEGDENRTLFGFLKKNNTVYVELKYGF